MNKVMFIGRLVKDPQMSSSQRGVAIAKFNLAVPRNTKEKTADFFNCVAFDKTAKIIDEYCRKGDMVMAEGRLTNNRYTDKNGVSRISNEVIVERIEFLMAKRSTVEKGYSENSFKKNTFDMDLTNNNEYEEETIEVSSEDLGF